MSFHALHAQQDSPHRSCGARLLGMRIARFLLREEPWFPPHEEPAIPLPTGHIWHWDMGCFSPDDKPGPDVYWGQH